METKLIKISFIIFLLGLILPFLHSQVQAEEITEKLLPEESLFQEQELPKESSMPGRIERAGTYFEIKESEYLKITLKSTEEVKVVLESIPRMISLDIEDSSGLALTELTLEGLEPNKTYYKYQDSYKNEAVFVSDENGSFSWTQDLSQPHHIWFQEAPNVISKDSVSFLSSTQQAIFLPDQCSTYGTWDPETSTCTLNQDLTQSVEITQNNITLNCIGHNITGNDTGYGIYLSSKQDIIVKNCSLFNFSIGIYLSYSDNNQILNNNINSGSNGIYLGASSYNTIMENVISNTLYTGLTLYHGPIWPGHPSSAHNTVTKNTITSAINSWYGNGIYVHDGWTASFNTISYNNILNNNYNGVLLDASYSNEIFGNNISSNRVCGIHVWHSHFTEIKNNNIQNNGCGIIVYSYSNKIYHNNFVENIVQASIPPGYGSFDIFFDDGYSSGGNYWSDYVGVDEKKGTNQDEPGSDGMGDTPCTFTGGQDKYPFIRESGWEAPPEPEKWSFAIITDLHIGRDYSDYDGTSYEDNGVGEDYYLTERLKKVVNWINDNKDKIDCEGTKCPIQFLTVLGDITNTAEKSQFFKAKNILDKLNDPNGDGNTQDGIPYVPIFGNHDVWPYTDDEESNSSLGEEYFDEVFWDPSNSNFQLIQKFFGDSWKRDEVHKWDKNFAFSYREMNFIGLDFNSRKPTPFGPGVGADAVLTFEDEGWLGFRLNEFKGEPTIIFSHHPLTFEGLPYSLPGSATAFSEDEINQIKEIIENKNVLANFGGHIHGVEKFLEIMDIFINANKEYSSIDNTRVVTTESLMVGSNEEDPKGIIRIVKVLEPTHVDYNNWETTEEEVKTEFVALNPSVSFTFTQLTELLPCVFFKGHVFTKREVLYSWDFGDGKTDVGKWDTHCYSSPGIYNVTLTLTDAKTGEKEYITQKVEVKEGIIPRFLKVTGEMTEKMELISTNLGEDLTKIGQVFKDNVLIKVKHSEAKPVGLITVHFGQATEDIDLTSMVADFDLERQKSILYMPTWPKEIEESKVLFIPSTGVGAVYICPEATSLDGITPLCPDIMVFDLGESKNDMMVVAVQYEEQEYYMMFGIEGTGGGEFGIAEKIIKNLNDYIRNLPDKAFKNNPQQRKNALKNKLGEAFIKIANNEYREAINKLQNDIRAKADGSVSENPKDDWIINPTAQKEICDTIDNLIVYLQGLFQ